MQITIDEELATVVNTVDPADDLLTSKYVVSTFSALDGSFTNMSQRDFVNTIGEMILDAVTEHVLVSDSTAECVPALVHEYNAEMDCYTYPCRSCDKYCEVYEPTEFEPEFHYCGKDPSCVP